MKRFKPIFLTALLSVVFSFSVTANDDAFVAVNILSKYRPRIITIRSCRDERRYDIEKLSDHLLLVNGLLSDGWQSHECERKPWHVTVGQTTRRYRGSLRVANEPGSLRIINRVKLTDYLMGVLAGEFAEAAPEALKAQAILARTLIYRKLATGPGKRPYDIGDLTNDQVYAGFFPFEKFADAVKDTANLVITHNGKLIEPFWHSTCGKRFITPKQAWNGPPLSYIVSGSSVSKYHCQKSPHYSWQRTISRKELVKILGISRLNINFPKLTASGITLGPENRQVTMEGFRLTINRVKGWNYLKSNDYRIVLEENDIRFSGFGLGHTIGMCQCQAIEMAKDGLSYRQILLSYYKEIKIEEWML